MHSWLPVFIIIGVIALVVGPVMMMRPSHRQKQLIALRAAATAAGMRLRLDAQTPKGNNSNAAIYSLPWSEAQAITPWCLKRQAFSHEVHFHQQWDWSGEGRCPAAWEAALLDIVSQLGDDIVGIEADQYMLGIFWQEKGGLTRFKSLEAELNRYRDTLSQRHL